jgi:hypothetical protein
LDRTLFFRWGDFLCAKGCGRRARHYRNRCSCYESLEHGWLAFVL